MGVFGTRYIRDDPLPASIELAKGTTQTLTVPHIYSQYTIGTTLAINLRQGSETLSFVSFEEQNSETIVTIDATGVEEGDAYDLTLESFNTLSTAKSALKTDLIKLTVYSAASSEPGFSSALTTQILYAGQASEWSLPAIVEGSYPLARI